MRRAVPSAEGSTTNMKNPFRASPPPVPAPTASAEESSSTAPKNAVSANLTLFRKSIHSQEPRSEPDKSHSTSGDSNDPLRKENPFKHLTSEQRDAVVENLEIEMADRLMRLRKQVDVLKQNLVFRGEIEIDRIPSSVRPLSMEEFWLQFNGDANAYRQRQAQLKADVQNSVMQLIGVHVDKNSSNLNSTSSNSNNGQRKRQRLEL
ncbi:hypothetical protein BGZ73_007892 [Actinomortierella ambigua]|nr:hypothetical protein BGZ73_007892 [Actinomortierella ambigua]